MNYSDLFGEQKQSLRFNENVVQFINSATSNATFSEAFQSKFGNTLALSLLVGQENAKAVQDGRLQLTDTYDNATGRHVVGVEGVTVQSPIVPEQEGYDDSEEELVKYYYDLAPTEIKNCVADRYAVALYALAMAKGVTV